MLFQAISLGLLSIFVAVTIYNFVVNRQIAKSFLVDRLNSDIIALIKAAKESGDIDEVALRAFCGSVVVHHRLNGPLADVKSAMASVLAGMAASAGTSALVYIGTFTVSLDPKTAGQGLLRVDKRVWCFSLTSLNKIEQIQ